MSELLFKLAGVSDDGHVLWVEIPVEPAPSTPCPPLGAHAVDVTPLGRVSAGPTKVRCRDCDWASRYPTRDHARACADEHTIRTHPTGPVFCDQKPWRAPQARPRCIGCAAIKRKNARR